MKKVLAFLFGLLSFGSLKADVHWPETFDKAQTLQMLKTALNHEGHDVSMGRYQYRVVFVEGKHTPYLREEIQPFFDMDERLLADDDDFNMVKLRHSGKPQRPNLGVYETLEMPSHLEGNLIWHFPFIYVLKGKWVLVTRAEKKDVWPDFTAVQGEQLLEKVFYGDEVENVVIDGRTYKIVFSKDRSSEYRHSLAGAFYEGSKVAFVQKVSGANGVHLMPVTQGGGFLGDYAGMKPFDIPEGFGKEWIRTYQLKSTNGKILKVAIARDGAAPGPYLNLLKGSDDDWALFNAAQMNQLILNAMGIGDFKEVVVGDYAYRMICTEAPSLSLENVCIFLATQGRCTVKKCRRQKTHARLAEKIPVPEGFGDELRVYKAVGNLDRILYFAVARQEVEILIEG